MFRDSYLWYPLGQNEGNKLYALSTGYSDIESRARLEIEFLNLSFVNHAATGNYSLILTSSQFLTSWLLLFINLILIRFTLQCKKMVTKCTSATMLPLKQL